MHRETLMTQFALTDYVLKRNLDGLTDDECFTRPHPGGNDLNWVLGHIVYTRNQALPMLGEEPVVPTEKLDSYRTGPIAREKALSLDELMSAFDSMQGPLMRGLGSLTPEKMSAPAPFSPTGNPKETIGSLMAGIAFHEAYHVGQTGLQRRLAGKPGVLAAPGG